MNRSPETKGVRAGMALGLLFLMPLIILAVGVSVSRAREITDMAGRRVTVPEKISRVCADWPPAEYMVYALDPGLLAGINMPFSDRQKEYVLPRVHALPVVKGFFGQGHATNMETLLKAGPEVIVAEIWGDEGVNRRSEEVLGRFGIPVVYINLDTIHDYPEALLFLGRLVGREKRARVLSDYGRKALTEVRQVARHIPRERRLRVYYAEGPTGLFTECHTSFHTELIELAGAVNVHRCPQGLFKVKGREPVSMEQVLKYDPDVIFTAESSFFGKVFKDERWRNMKAVRSGRVYLTPRLLFNWFDRPPSLMRFLGARWVAWRLYPDRYRIDMEKEAMRFYRLFLGVTISRDVMRRVIEP